MNQEDIVNALIEISLSNHAFPHEIRITPGKCVVIFPFSKNHNNPRRTNKVLFITAKDKQNPDRFAKRFKEALNNILAQSTLEA